MKRNWLIESRKAKGLTQEQLAEMCNTTQMTISNIENGTRRPSPRLSKLIANVLNLDWTKFYEEQQSEI